MRMLHLFLSATFSGAVLAACAPVEQSVAADSAQTLLVTGSVTMRERLALSPAAVAEVVLRDGTGADAPVLARQTIPFNGRQVPVDFSLTVEQSRLNTRGNHTLHATIEDGGRRWSAQAPVTATAGTPRYDAGTLVVVADAAGTTPAPPAAAGYRARGNEPGWVLEFGSSELSFVWNTGQDRMTAPLPTAQPTTTGRRYEARGQGKTLVIDVTNKVCRDTMSGMSYPDTVSVTLDGRRMDGCGGQPASLLHGGEWTVENIAGTAVVPNTKVTMTFGPEGGVSGSGGCNRFNASYTLTGEGLTIGLGIRTQMACEPPIMQQEDRFLNLLGQVQGFEIPGPGRLALVTGKGERIVARR